MATRTLMIMAGGTGGHIYPGLAVAKTMSQQGWRVVWLGSQHGMEMRLVPPFGYETAWLSIGGLRGKTGLNRVKAVFGLARALWQSWQVLRRFRPDVVLGMGGYPSFPGGLMASVMRKPLLIHEQNAIAGLSNRILACRANKVLTGFPGVFGRPVDRPLPCGKVVAAWTGNPVRAEIAAVVHDEGLADDVPLRVLVVGGSLGAAALNQVVPEALALILAEHRPQVVHQSGRQHLQALQQAYAAAGVAAEVVEFIDNMADRYAWCDVAITRAGALTLAELAAAGVPALLVPYPHAVDDHQTENARFLVDSGAAQLIPQRELTAADLAARLSQFSREQLRAMGRCARAVAKPDAAEKVAQFCREAVQ